MNLAKQFFNRPLYSIAQCIKELEDENGGLSIVRMPNQGITEYYFQDGSCVRSTSSGLEYK